MNKINLKMDGSKMIYSIVTRRKVVVDLIEEVSVEAESEKEAIKAALNNDENKITDYWESEFDADTIKPLSIKENIAIGECDYLMPDDNWDQNYNLDEWSVASIVRIKEMEN